MLKVIGGAGLLSLVLAMLSSGALVSGDRMRANYHTESKESRKERIGMINICLAFSIPNLIGAATCIAIVVRG